MENKPRRSANHVRRRRKLINDMMKSHNPISRYIKELEYKAMVFELALRISCTKTAATVEGAVDRYRTFLADAMDIENNDMAFAKDGSFGVRRTPDLQHKIYRLKMLQNKTFSDIISDEITRCLESQNP